MELVSKDEFKRRMAQPPRALQDAVQSNESVVETSAKQQRQTYSVTSVAELRGSHAIANIKPSKNMADTPSQLSIPVACKASRPEKVGRVNCDLTKHVQRTLALTGESPFAKDACSTKKGWKMGSF